MKIIGGNYMNAYRNAKDVVHVRGPQVKIVESAPIAKICQRMVGPGRKKSHAMKENAYGKLMHT